MLTLIKSKRYSSLIPVYLILLSLLLHGCNYNLKPGNNKSEQLSTTSLSTSTFGLDDITTFDVYADKNAIHLFIGGKISPESKQIELRYIQSNDGGASWTKPITVANVPAIINNRGNDVQIAAQGDSVLALWQAKGELPGMGPLVSGYSADGGKTWQKGKNPAINDAGDQSHSDLIADSQGRFHAAWLEDPEENGYQSLRYANTETKGQSWSKAATLDDSTCSCCWNTLTLSPNNEINLYYRDMKPRDMALLRSTDNGISWQNVSTVGAFGWQFDGCPHVGGALAYGNDNPKRLNALSWTGLEGKSGLYFMASDDSGQHWSKPFMLGKQAVHGDIAVFHDEVIVIWDEMGDDGYGIFVSTSEDKGKTWLPAQKLSQPQRNATHPRVIATESGVLSLWTEKSADQPSQLVWLPLKPQD